MAIESQFVTANGENEFVYAEPHVGARISRQDPDDQLTTEILERGMDKFETALKALSDDKMMGFLEEGMKQYDNALRELAK